MHGGRVAAQSGGPGRGTELTVWVPCAKADEVPLSAAADVDEGSAKRERSTTVLVVDDNEDAAELLAHALRCRGFVVEVAHDGPSALERASAVHPEVVLLDIGLPVMDGYEVAQRLRSSSDVPLKKLIAITGYGQIEDRRRAIAAGFDLHFVKPVDVTKVLAAVIND
jgi:CheY-like chemotaxis protein